MKKITLQDEEVMREIAAKFPQDGTESPPGGRSSAIGEEIPRGLESLVASTEDPPLFFPEAIVLEHGRPALLVQNNQIQVPTLEAWRSRIDPKRTDLEIAIKSVGRIELYNHPTHDWVGTGFMLDDNVIVTNRHVAELFSRRRMGLFAFSVNPHTNRTVKAKIDFREEHLVDVSEEFDIAQILHVEPAGSQFPDLAFLRVKSYDDLPGPLELYETHNPQDFVAVVGYPAYDTRNDAGAMQRIFSNVFNVKRFSPGKLMNTNYEQVFSHDCSSLGGASGSPIISFENGKVVGLHFGGRYKTANYAVKASVVKQRLSSINNEMRLLSVPVNFGVSDSEDIDEAPRNAEEYAYRTGYDTQFLNESVALPVLNDENKIRIAEVNPPSSAHGEGVLDYTNFSLVMNAERGLAFYTAVNIDGGNMHRIPRARDKWYVDPRISREHQRDNRLYCGNDLDRGHLVRRLDPMWGSRDSALNGQEDSFHYTNAAPQHKDLNRRVWLDLENYILDSTDQHDLKISVFTGPVFAVEDPDHRGTLIPESYWKVVAFNKADGSGLSATGYMLSQAQMIDFAEFTFGAYRTYQVPIQKIEDLTGISFNNLKEFDPLANTDHESLGPGKTRAIDDISQIML